MCRRGEERSPFMYVMCVSQKRSGDDKRLNLGLLWIICWIFVVRKTSRVAYSFNYTEGGLTSLKAEWTKTATLKCWEHTALARHEAPAAQNNKLISSFEHLWTWFCNFICFWSTVHVSWKYWSLLISFHSFIYRLFAVVCTQLAMFYHSWEIQYEHLFLRKCIYSFLTRRRLLNKDKW